MKIIPANAEKRHFKSGKCKECHDKQELCKSCRKYVDQDYIGRRGLPAYGDILDKLIFHGEIREIPTTDLEIPPLRLLLRGANLSKQQRQIIILYFSESISFRTISKTLAISKDSVALQFHRAIEKLKSCHTNRVLLRGRDIYFGSSKPISRTNVEKKHTPSNELASQNPRQWLFSRCPRCTSKIFSIDRDFQYCADCMWTSDDREASRK